MIAIKHKNKQYLLVALKVFLLGFTISYIYIKINSIESLDLNKFFSHIFYRGNNSLFSFLFFLLLAISNWFYEILKWKTVVSQIQKLSFLEAMKQCLISLTISLPTPNRIGEYGAKAYFFNPKKRKTILLLTFFSNFMQMAVTLIFGAIGIFYITQKYELPFSSIKLIWGYFQY